MLRIINEYRKWRKNWDAICGRCGLCCYPRSLSPKGEVIVDFNSPCEYLDKETRLCRIFKERYKKCSHCIGVNFFRALFYPWLPPTCAYVKTFRPWRRKTP